LARQGFKIRALDNDFLTLLDQHNYERSWLSIRSEYRLIGKSLWFLFNAHLHFNLPAKHDDEVGGANLE